MAKELPQLTFTEAEHSALVDYLNFIHNRAVFKEMTQKEAYTLGQLYANSATLVKKIEDHIFEFKRLTKTGD